MWKQRAGRRRTHVAAAMIVVALAVTGSGPTAGAGGRTVGGAGRAGVAAPLTSSGAFPGWLRVSGDRLLDGRGNPVLLSGVSRSGTEYACAEGWGIFDGPSGASSVAAMATWHFDAVRVPLNEDCWLGINGVPAAVGGAAYRSAITGWVDLLVHHGFAVILDLHWSAPGRVLTAGQAPMPDESHSPLFWTEVARTFRSTPGVAFEIYNEPHGVSWTCWVHGCLAPGFVDGKVQVGPYRAAGMQQLVDAVRRGGARQPILVEGLSWGNDLAGWLTHPLRDPAHDLAAAWHVYQNNACSTPSCWDAIVLPVAARVPVVTTEFGQTGCGTTFASEVARWARAHGVGYLAWAWDTWSGCGGPSLLRTYAGVPTGYGAALRPLLARRARDSGPAGGG